MMSSVFFQLIVHLHLTVDLFWFSGRVAQWPSSFRWSPGALIDFSWLLFVLYWLATAIRAKKPAKQQSRGARLVYIAYMAVGFWLVWFSAPPLLDFLNRRFVSDDRWILWLGAALVFAGIFFAIWARATIGRNWSAEVQIKQEHQLIRSGPYAHIRHPIYTGMLIAVAGSALAIGEYHALFGLLVVGFGFARKAKTEEAFLSAQFGPAFAEHQRHTGFFLPRFN